MTFKCVWNNIKVKELLIGKKKLSSGFSPATFDSCSKFQQNAFQNYVSKEHFSLILSFCCNLYIALTLFLYTVFLRKSHKCIFLVIKPLKNWVYLLLVDLLLQVPPNLLCYDMRDNYPVTKCILNIVISCLIVLRYMFLAFVWEFCEVHVTVIKVLIRGFIILYHTCIL